ncbi:Uma2 family endonuclease [Kineosporia sp. J2-2]|uniref:Uma2 family endonuclease n=1 Tax=Kineosporia corallincola TaxID=2835133 RepID=A0ABS5TA94_9ACTN|nr:Uma2 family endonuclease [Kineosporia corallincola]MBT0767783.1 Uma2 family endonuclease [Kineosporia corallincola]
MLLLGFPQVLTFGIFANVQMVGGSEMATEAVPQARTGACNDALADSNEPIPDRPRKPGGFTVDEFFQLPDLPPHTELIDGELVFASLHRWFHMRTLRLLEQGLVGALPPRFEVNREMSVTIGERQVPEPDLSVIPAAAVHDHRDTWYPADVVILAVEVESPESEARDRERKPQLYARAGIQHFWRVEEQDGQPVVYVYELDPVTQTYLPTGIHRDRLKLTAPFDLDLELVF